MYRFQLFLKHEQSLWWRMMGGNNRVLALSPYPFKAADQGFAHIRLVQQLAERTAAVVELDPVAGTWSWRLDAANGPAAVCPTAFARRIDAETAARRFCTRVADAVIMTTVVDHGQRLRGRVVRVARHGGHPR